MRNLRSYYSSEIEDFLNKSDSEILGIIYKNGYGVKQDYNNPNPDINIESIKINS